MGEFEPMNEKYYTPHEVADQFGLTVRTVYHWIRIGRLKAYKVGQWRIAESDLIELMNASPNGDPVQRHNKK